MPEIGIQLYTIRDEVEKDIRNALRRISSAGYNGVEFAFNYGGLQPEELGALLEESRLECAGIYTDCGQAASPLSPAYEYARALKSPYIVTGLNNMVSEEAWPQAVKMTAEAGAAAQSEGRTLLYHNHWQEFKKIRGKYALDILFEETDPEKVQFELDTGWLLKAGLDPVEYIKKYSGRLPSLHVRDFHPDFEVSELGGGMVDLPSVIDRARRAGVHWLVFEQSVGTLESAAASYRFLDNNLKKEHNE